MDLVMFFLWSLVFFSIGGIIFIIWARKTPLQNLLKILSLPFVIVVFLAFPVNLVYFSQGRQMRELVRISPILQTVFISGVIFWFLFCLDSFLRRLKRDKRKISKSHFYFICFYLIFLLVVIIAELIVFTLNSMAI